jgi:molybdopterin/thiamine biosynthesis adenylyltransferase
MTSDEDHHSPIFLKGGSSAENILKENQSISFVDAFERQLRELFLIDNKKYIGLPKDELYKSKAFYVYQKERKNDYVYVYYPWTATVVKTIKEKDYFKLKTNRNRDLITPTEQNKLYKYNVAVFGMSVGSNIAFVLTQSGISKEIIVADFDELDTTNLNRIWAGAHQIGLNKAVISARRIYEDNPFAKVRVLEEGIDANNLEILLRTKKIQCIIEEIDNLFVKIEVRKLALKYKVPVLMITDNADGVVLHVERYDLGYKRVFNKSFNTWEKKISSVKSPADIGNLIVNDVIGGPEKVEKRVLQSVEKVLARKLISWSQLGTAAMLGGVIATVYIKDIALGINIKRYIYKNIQPRVL